MRSLLRSALFGAALGVGLGAVAAGCSLGNVSYSACSSDAECSATFGAGSACSGGFCGAPATCKTGHDCRAQLGGGACVGGTCQSAIPAFTGGATLVYPAGLMSQPLVGADAPVVIGGIFALSDPNEVALTKAIELAITEINQGGLNSGQQLGIIVCDNGGKGNAAMGSARQALDDQALDYLAGTLGVPYIVGPLTSADALLVVDELLKQQYPTVVISPSATSPALTTTDKRLQPSDPYPLFWRTCPSDEIQGEVLAKDVIGPIATIKTVTVVYINDAYGQGLATVFQNDYGVTSTNLVPFQSSTPDAATLMALASTASGKDGDAVLVITESGALTVQILEAMTSLPIASKPFFFTDGSMDPALLSNTLPPAVLTILKTAQGTAPASPSGQNYAVFSADLQMQFQVNAGSFSFLAQSYDATYVGAFGLVSALKKGNKYNGLDVAAGMANESAGTLVELNGVSAWDMGKGLMISPGRINVDGTSGPLDFDSVTGEAPASILVWGIDQTTSMFTTVTVVPPGG